MSRSQPYRGKMPVEILKTLDVASRITLFMVGQSGPLSFTFKDRLDNKYKTSIGAQLKCSCSPTKNDHCIHTLYVLLKIFRVSPQNPIIWQAAYVDSELSDLLAGKYTVQTNRRVVRPVFQQISHDYTSELPSQFLTKKHRQRAYSFPEAKAERMKLNEGSVCPICQESMTEDECLSFCKVKCGNNFHLECLKVWAEHKSTTQSSITCPMCRTPFGNLILQQLRHEQKQFKKVEANKIRIKFKCSGCGVEEIPKSAHKCVLCTSYELCEVCYKANKHIKHPFIRQLDDCGRWCGGEQRREDELKMKKFIDNKRKQKNVNEQLIEKLRKIEQDPNKLLDFVASTYPYVSKFISDNVDPYKKLDLDPDDMKCMKCCSKKMLFLRRLTCGHFIDHECLKDNLRKGRFHCESCGSKLVKGYENLISKEKQLEESKQKMLNVSQEFNPRTMEKNNDNYNFILPDEATLGDILGGRVRQVLQHQQDESRLRQRLASNLVRGSEALETFRNSDAYKSETHEISSRARNQSTTIRTHHPPTDLGNRNNLRIRNVPRPTPSEQPQIQPRSVSRNASRKAGNKKAQQNMAFLMQAMIGRKIKM